MRWCSTVTSLYTDCHQLGYICVRSGLYGLFGLFLKLAMPHYKKRFAIILLNYSKSLSGDNRWFKIIADIAAAAAFRPVYIAEEALGRS